MKKISLCICFYNSEEFIKRALDSFVQFLTDEIEVILVNDGSNDNSLEIVKSYVLKYNQMKIVQHQKNKGLSLARKTAVNHSTANHVMFLDADDEFIKNPFALFLNNKDLHSLDVIEYGAITDKNEVYLNKSYKYGEIIEASIYLNDYFKFKNVYVSLCMRLFKKELFYPISFSETFRIHEDNMSLPLILSRANKVIILDEVLLQINSNPNSITRKHFTDDIKANTKKKLHLKARFFYELILHLNNNLGTHSKNKNYDRFIIQMVLYHSFYSATESITLMLRRQKNLINNSSLRSFLNFNLVKRIKSPINLAVIFFGFRLTSVLIFYVSKLNLLVNQKIKKVV